MKNCKGRNHSTENCQMTADRKLPTDSDHDSNGGQQLPPLSSAIPRPPLPLPPPPPIFDASFLSEIPPFQPKISQESGGQQ